MRGKVRCKKLKEIRQAIADQNDIEYVTKECTYQGDCSGTCPRCEAEVRYLEQELEKRKNAGKKVAVAAVCASISLSMAGCEFPSSDRDLGGIAEPMSIEIEEPVLSGDVSIAPEDEEETENIQEDEIEQEDENLDEMEIAGDMKQEE